MSGETMEGNYFFGTLPPNFYQIKKIGKTLRYTEEDRWRLMGTLGKMAIIIHYCHKRRVKNYSFSHKTNISYSLHQEPQLSYTDSEYGIINK